MPTSKELRDAASLQEKLEKLQSFDPSKAGSINLSIVPVRELGPAGRPEPNRNAPVTITIKPDNPQFQAIMDIVTGTVEAQKDQFATEAQDQLAGMGVKKDA